MCTLRLPDDRQLLHMPLVELYSRVAFFYCREPTHGRGEHVHENIASVSPSGTSRGKFFVKPQAVYSLTEHSAYLNNSLLGTHLVPSPPQVVVCAWTCTAKNGLNVLLADL